MLKCPYCIETRSNRLSLRNHVDQIHRHAEDTAARHRAVAQARKVEDTPLPEGAAVVMDLPPVCVCGEPIELLDEDIPDGWVHVIPKRTQCLDAVPAKRTIASQGRKQLSEQLAETGTKLYAAGLELADLKSKTEAVLARLEALDNPAVAPDVVRRATLNQVWDKLMDEGNIGGAGLVMRMIGQLSEGDWS